MLMVILKRKQTNTHKHTHLGEDLNGPAHDGRACHQQSSCLVYPGLKEVSHKYGALGLG